MNSTDTTIARPSGRHPVSIGHLVMGIAFAGVLTVWALYVGEVVDSTDLRWLTPAPWLLAGVAGLAATIARRSTSVTHEPVDTGSEDDTQVLGPDDRG